MANAKKAKTTPIDPIKLKQERSLLVQTIGDEAYAVEVYKANITQRSMRINAINLSLQEFEKNNAKPAPELAKDVKSS